MSESPSPNGAKGRGSDGRFAKGNAGGPGNPHAAQVAALRSALLNAISPEKMTAVVEKLIAEALEGNVQAAREVLERAVGRPIEADLLERLERLEAAAQAAQVATKWR